MNIVMEGSGRLVVLLQIVFQVSLACPVAVNNPLNLGYVNSCVPGVNISTECDDVIDWYIPEPIVSLASIKDAFISGILDQLQSLEGENCLNGIRQALCFIEYPRCLVNSSQVDTAIQQDDCLAMFSSLQCNSQLRGNQFCSFFIQGVTLDQCRTIEEYSITYSHNLIYCSELGSDWMGNYVTEWMFAYIRDIDKEIGLFISLFDANCRQKYISFQCNSIGRCWNQGTQVELVVNQSDCLEVRDNWYVVIHNTCTHTLYNVARCDMACLWLL